MNYVESGSFVDTNKGQERILAILKIQSEIVTKDLEVGICLTAKIIPEDLDFFDRGKAPEGMPGAERFDPDYDGSMPEGRKSPFGFAAQKVNKEKNL